MENQNELEFYSKFTRPLIFTLPESKDRVLASAWVKKIKEDEQAGDKLKTDYIKLLLFALQRKKLVGLFAEDPSGYETLEEFPDEYDLNYMAQELIAKEMKNRRNNIRRELQGQSGDFPPYTTDVSSDLREYVAAQDIPGFGVHCYYAVSKDPVTHWQRANKGLFPKPAKSAVNTSSPFPLGLGGTDSNVCVECPGPKGEGPCNPKKAEAAPLSDSEKKKKFKRKLGETPPVKPLATEPPPMEEERKPPTWASNLIDVVERPRPTAATGAIPKVRTQKQIRKAREKQERFGDVDSDLEEDYNEMERALKDFQRGEIKEQRRKKQRRSEADDDDDNSDDDEEKRYGQNKQNEGDIAAGNENDFENFFDLNETEYEQELQEDSMLVKYFRDTLNKRSLKKKMDDVTENVRGTLPAELGIPITTPKPSVSPKRLKSSSPIYLGDEPLSRDTTKQTDTGSPKPKCSYVCSGRDPEMDKLFEEASALAASIDDDLEADLSDVTESGAEEVQQQQDQEERPQELPPEPIPPPPEPLKMLTRGSPAANKIFAEVVPPLMQQLQTDVPPYTSEMEDVYTEDESDFPPPPVDGGRICNEQQQQEPMFQIPQYDEYYFDPMTVLADTTLDELVPSSPPYCSDQPPQKEPCRAPCAQPPQPTQQTQIPKPAQQLQKPSGIRPPSRTPKLRSDAPYQTSSSTQASSKPASTKPRPGRIPQPSFRSREVSSGPDGRTRIPQKSNTQSGPGTTGRPGPSQLKPCPTGGRGRASGLPQPSSTKTDISTGIQPVGLNGGPSGIERGSGIPQPSRQTSVPQLGADRGSRIPKPGSGRGIPVSGVPPPYGQQTSGLPIQRPPPGPLIQRSPPQVTICPSTLAKSQSQPLYFSPYPINMQPQWPEADDNLVSDLQRHQIDPSFRDPGRPAMQSDIQVGKTSGKTMPIQRICPSSMAKRQPIPEGNENQNISRSFNQQGSPARPFPQDDTMLSFARGYVPPTYQSPPGLDDESPPQLVSPERREVLSLREYSEDRRVQSQRALGDVIQTLAGTKAGSPPYTPCPSSKNRRFPARKLNFDDSDTRGDTDTFLAGVVARHKDLPPLPPDYMPQQRIKSPPRSGGIPGWDSPDKPLPQSPPFPQSPVPAQMLDRTENPICYDSPEPPDSPPTGNNIFDTSMEFFDSPPGSPWNPPQLSPDRSPGMQQMLDRLPQAQSYFNQRDRGQGARQRISQPPGMSPIAGSPPPEDKFGLPSIVQYSPLSKFAQYDKFYSRYPDLKSPPAALTSPDRRIIPCPSGDETGPQGSKLRPPSEGPRSGPGPQYRPDPRAGPGLRTGPGRRAGSGSQSGQGLRASPDPRAGPSPTAGISLQGRRNGADIQNLQYIQCVSTTRGTRATPGTQATRPGRSSPAPRRNISNSKLTMPCPSSKK